MQQQSFVQDTWKVGDYVTINGLHGEIRKFESTKGKVMIQHIDPEGEKYPRLYSIGDLPPYPAPGKDETEPDDDEDTTPPEAPEPIPAAIIENKPQFAEGHTRRQLNGTELVVVNRADDDLYDCRVTVASGGTYPTQKTAAQIEKWGHPVDIQIEDITTAVNDEIDKTIDPPAEPSEGEKDNHLPSDTDDIAAPPAAEEEEKKVLEDTDTQELKVITVMAKPEPECRREMLFEQMIVEDGNGTYSDKASKRLTGLVNDDWQLMFSETKSIWIPAKSVQDQSHVRTTVYWTFTRVVELD